MNIFPSPEDVDVEEVSIIEGRLTDAHNTLTLLIDSVSDIESEFTTTGRSHCNLLGHLHELRESVREISQYCITLNNVHSQNQESDDCLGPVSFSAPISWPPVLTPERPRRDITKDQLEHLRTLQFSWTKIAELLGTSIKTIQRRREEFQLSDRFEKYSGISDEELDSVYKEIAVGSQSSGFLTPNLGRRRFIGALRSQDLRVQRWRVSECIRRCDPVGTALRWRTVIHRRKYFVPAPNSLWHIDSCHKLIRYKMVVHVCIDGKTRLLVYCSCHDNNKAETVLTLFKE